MKTSSSQKLPDKRLFRHRIVMLNLDRTLPFLRSVFIFYYIFMFSFTIFPMKIITGLFLLLGLAVFANAQNKPCKLTLDDMPTVRGLRLGMSKAELAKILPAYADQDRARILQPELGSIPGFENVEKVLFEFFGTQSLRFLFIAFDKNVIKWKDAKDFTQNLPANIKLPAECWVYSATDIAAAKIEENGLGIYVNSERSTIIFMIFFPNDEN